MGWVRGMGRGVRVDGVDVAVVRHGGVVVFARDNGLFLDSCSGNARGHGRESARQASRRGDGENQSSRRTEET